MSNDEELEEELVLLLDRFDEKSDDGGKATKEKFGDVEISIIDSLKDGAIISGP